MYSMLLRYRECVCCQPFVIFDRARSSTIILRSQHLGMLDVMYHHDALIRLFSMSLYSFLTPNSKTARYRAQVSTPNADHASATMVVRILPCSPGPALLRVGQSCVAIAAPTSHIIQTIVLRALRVHLLSSIDTSLSPMRPDCDVAVRFVSPFSTGAREGESNVLRRRNKNTKGMHVIVRTDTARSSAMIGSGAGRNQSVIEGERGLLTVRVRGCCREMSAESGKTELCGSDRPDEDVEGLTLRDSDELS